MSRIGKWSLVAILCLGAIMTIIGSLQDAPTLAPAPGLENPSLSPPDRAYLDFMVPRLDRLIQEGTAVSALVNERSRDVFALSRHGSRITALTSDIIEWDTGNEVPGRFRSSHTSLLASAHELERLIGEAQRGLLTFDFGDISDLFPRFDNAIATIEAVRETFPVPADRAP